MAELHSTAATSKTPRPTRGWLGRLAFSFLRPMIADRAMFHERPFPGMTFFLWTYPFTPAGKVVMVALSVSALAGAITEEMPIYQIPVTLGVLVLVASGVGSVLRWLSVSISGDWPDRVTTGQTVHGEFTVTNDGRWALLDVSLAVFKLPAMWESVRDERMVPTLAAGESVKLPIRVIPRRRGRYMLPVVRAFSTFPFNLFRNQLGHKVSRPILVLPQFEPLQQIHLDIGNRYQSGGITFTSHVGESPEYIGSREYLPGDSPRHIDFRSWARLAKPVVREYQEEYFHRLGLVLDTFVPREWLSLKWLSPEWLRRRNERGLEAAISLTASVADVFSRGEDLLDVFAAGPELHVFRTGRSTTPIEAVLEILADVPPCREDPFDQMTAALANELPQISAIFCIFLDWDQSRQRLVQAALDSGCRVKVVVIQSRFQPLPELDRADVEVLQFTADQIESGLGEL
ncbi:MAG: DUF58 domain-containing protein [Planctomycetes bacterium]|nr:DUF58 domain-containing protein [Planctomycetota bacterium]